jgi:hypothetical protein
VTETAAPGTLASIVRRAGELLAAIDELLRAEEIAQVAELLQTLGVHNTARTVIARLSGVLEDFAAWLETIKEPLDQTWALSGLVGLLRPLVVGVGRLVTVSLDELRQLGLGELQKAVGPARLATKIGGRIIDVGERVLEGLPHSDDITALQQDVRGLVRALRDFSARLARPLPPKPSQPALPTGGLT